MYIYIYTRGINIGDKVYFDCSLKVKIVSHSAFGSFAFTLVRTSGSRSRPETTIIFHFKLNPLHLGEKNRDNICLHIIYVALRRYLLTLLVCLLSLTLRITVIFLFEFCFPQGILLYPLANHESISRHLTETRILCTITLKQT